MIRLMEGFDWADEVLGNLLGAWQTIPGAGEASFVAGRIGLGLKMTAGQLNCWTNSGSPPAGIPRLTLADPDAWIQFWCVLAALPSSGYTNLCHVTDGFGANRVQVGSDGSVRIRQGYTDALLGTSAAGVVAAGVPFRLALKNNEQPTVHNMTVRIDEAEVVTGSSGAGLGGSFYAGVYGDATMQPTFDDVFIYDGVAAGGTGPQNDDWLGDYHVSTIDPADDGAVIQMDGSDGDQVDNFALVSDADDVTYVVSDVVDEEDVYVHEAMPDTLGLVAAVQVNVRALYAGTVRKVAVVQRLSGTDEAGPDIDLAASVVTRYGVFQAKPGGGAWTLDDLDPANASFGPRVR